MVMVVVHGGPDTGAMPYATSTAAPMATGRGIVPPEGRYQVR